MSQTNELDFSVSVKNNNELVHYTKNRAKPAAYYKNQYKRRNIVLENSKKNCEESKNEDDKYEYSNKTIIDIAPIDFDFDSGLEKRKFNYVQDSNMDVQVNYK